MSWLDALARFFDAIVRALPLVGAWYAGRAGSRAGALATAKAIRDDQLDIAAAPPRGRADLLERLRSAGL